jgi:hypothetical protein
VKLCLFLFEDIIMATATKMDRVLAALKEGEELTAKQISARFKAGNPTALVSDLRRKGYAIYANKRTNKGGETRTFYRLGTPSRRVVAAGYAALGAAA